MTRRLVLDQVVAAAQARVVVERAADGTVRSARFDLAGLPRVDALLVGRPAADVPGLVARLCGICPAAHHLAGVAAVEAVLGLGAPTPTADAVRRLLHHGSAVVAQALRLTGPDHDDALVLHRFGRAAVAAAGSPGHFPVTAVPGGVRAAVGVADRDLLAQGWAQALAAAERVCRRALVDPPPAMAFTGADAALVAADGTPDLLGRRLRVVGADGEVLVAAASAGDWDTLVAEQLPGEAAPRPYLVALGPDRGRYRVGPIAQLRVGPLATERAAAAQAAWSATGGGAGAARAVVGLHSVEAIGELLGRPELVAGPVLGPLAGTVPAVAAAGVGVGWVDGPRGLLVHRYATAADGTITAALLLTPTAQNEPWLAQLLGRVAGGPDDGGPQDGGPGADLLGLESAIREADPCLPCSSAPAGAMGLQVSTLRVGAASAPAEGC